MTRKTGRAWIGSDGIAAPSGNDCHLCGKDMLHTKDMTKHRGRWIHKTCAPGADDE